MEIFKTSEVFTPTSPAKYTFIERETEVNDLLVDSLNTQGKQIIIFGHTGCGKTTLLLNKLNQLYEGYIITRCMKATNFDNIVLDGFDQLSPYYLDEMESEKSRKSGATLGIEYNTIKLQISEELAENNKSKSKRVLPPQLTAQRLAKFFGEKKFCWVLEDFHKVENDEKSKVAQMMKVFMDTSFEYPDLKLIAIGAVGTGREVIEYDKEMNGRVAEIHVPLMKEKEIVSIIKKGQELLRIKIEKIAIDKIAKFSSGLASVCHQLCLNMCFSKNINYTQEVWTSLYLSNLDNAIQKYLVQKSDTFKAQFDKAIRIDHSSTFNLPREILKAAIDISKDEFSFGEILKPLKKKFSDIPEGIVKKVVEEFQTGKRSEILFIDTNSNKYFFSSHFTKAYIGLRFEEERMIVKEKLSKKKLEEKRIERLLEIIEKDINDEDSGAKDEFDESGDPTSIDES